MANPATREQLKEYCLRRLGKPVIEINVDDDQLEDRIDEALQYYREYHFDATERVYLKHTITSTDIANRYVSIPDAVIGISRVISETDYNANNMFSVRYQLRLNELYDFTSTSVIHYDMVMRHISLLDQILKQDPGIQFNRHMNRLLIQGLDWGRDLTANNSVLVIECYRVLDPDTYTDVWNDMFLKEYTTALFKLQWGENLQKFEGVQLVGGMTLNGEKIFNDAKEEIDKLKEEMQLKWEEPPHFLVG